MESNINKFLESLSKRFLFVIIIIFILMIFITGFLYWEYLYLPLNQDLEPPVVVGPEIEKENLEKIIKNLETREKNYYQSLNQEYLDPFQ